MKKVLISCLLIFTFIIISCTKDDGSAANNQDGFDRTLLTKAWVNDLLIPAITDLKTELNNLENASETFITTSTVDNLENLRDKWLSAYKVWQHVHIFVQGSFNADMTTSYGADMNSYPVDIKQIEANVTANNESLPIHFDRHNDAQGFPTIDYLINGLADGDTEIISKFENKDYRDYLMFLVKRMKTLTQDQIDNIGAIDVNNVSNNGNSYFNKQINDIIQYIERSFREAKIAEPSGTRNRLLTEVKIDAGVVILPKPTSVESRFSSEHSKTLYLEAYDAVLDVYYGRKYKDNTSTVGIQNYLQFLETTIMVADKEELLLDDYITSLLDKITITNNNLGANFYNQTQEYNINFNATFDAIQEYVLALKGNTLSAFNVTIDYADNDGD